MSEFAGNLPRKFISFRHLGFESSAHDFPEGRESENPQTVEEVVGTSTDGVGETSNSPKKVMSVLETVPVASEVEKSERVEKDRELTTAEKDCVLTSSGEEMDDLNAFVTERLHCLSEGSVERLIGEECVNMEEALCGNVGVEEGGGGEEQAVGRNMPVAENDDDRRLSPNEETNRILREDSCNANITSTPKRVAWPMYTERRSSVVSGGEERHCKTVMFDVAGGSDPVGAVESRGTETFTSEGVPESLVTSGGFSVLEGIARRQADEGVVGIGMFEVGEGMVRVPPVDEMLGRDFSAKERTKYYPSQSAKSLLKDCFELNPPTYLDPSHPTTSFSADQMIQFARAVGLEVSLASYSMLEDLLLKSRRGGGDCAGTSRCSAGKSPFPSVAGSSVGDSVASRSFYSLPTITEVDVAVMTRGGEVVEEPCSSRQADERLTVGIESSERPGTDSLKTLQQIKSSQRKKKSQSCKWSREGRLNPLLPCGADKGGYVFTEEMLELAPFAKVFATGPEDPLENKYCFYCMLCRRNISMRTRGLYELKRHFQRDCHFRADQRFREKYCPGKVRGRDGRVLHGLKLEAERDIYMDLDVPDLDFKRPFYYDVLEGKPFAFTTEESRVRIQINLLITFLKNGGQLWALEDYWTQVGIATGHSAAVADFNWSPAHVSVSDFDFLWDSIVIVMFLSFGQYVGTRTVVCPEFSFGWAKGGYCAFVLTICVCFRLFFIIASFG